jgi:hypothetical protein
MYVHKAGRIVRAKNDVSRGVAKIGLLGSLRQPAKIGAVTEVTERLLQ